MWGDWLKTREDGRAEVDGGWQGFGYRKNIIQLSKGRNNVGVIIAI